MILRDHDIEITHTDQYRHKYDSAITEYLHQLSLDSSYDDASGNVDCSTGWFARFGKRLLFEDSQGFVGSHRFPTEAEAIDQYAVLATEYDTWASDDDPNDLGSEET